MKEEFMREALRLAEKAKKKGEVPIGAVVVLNGKIVGKGYNLRTKLQMATAHAEVRAIERACKKMRSWRLPEAEIYVTLEPCPMCMGAILNARIPVVRYGAKDDKAGCCGSVLNLFEERFNHHPRIYGGLLERECAALLQGFFSGLR